MMRFCDVVVDLSAEAVDRTYTYAVPEGMELELGWQVEIPFGPRKLEGFVVDIRESCDLPPEKVKNVLRTVRDSAVILPDQLSLARWMHERYLCNFVDALRLMIPAQMRGERVRPRYRRYASLAAARDEVLSYIEKNPRAVQQHFVLKRLMEGDQDTASLPSGPLKALEKRGLIRIHAEEEMRKPADLRLDERSEDPVLTPAQAAAVSELTEALERGGDRYLLKGVTGSGKTEVYIRLIRSVLSKGRSAIVLVPEIALTPQMVRWLHARFGADAAVLHSGLSAGERFDEWRRIRFGDARVVIGARSAVFAPLENIGAIVVDEEHEASYISDQRPRYDTREVALYRAEQSGAVLLLGSATPSLSSFMRAMPGVRPENRLKLIELNERVLGRKLPDVDLVDMRGEFEKGNHGIFSAKLARALKQCYADKRQSILFINRRGYSTFVSCRSCGKAVKCDECDVTMTYHQVGERLRCHYCGRERPVPRVCPACGSRYIRFFGAGTQKVEEAVRVLLPEARLIRMDMDTTQGKDAHGRLLEEFRSGRADIMIGTQMIAKGLDFPEVTLVGVVAADTMLNLPDYRSAERTFQLITQVAGRAGRAEHPGRVIVQSYEPEHYAIQLAAKQDYRAFYTREIAVRKSSLYPPYTVIMRTVYSGSSAETVRETAEKDAESLRIWLEENGHWKNIVQMRALAAPIGLLRGKTRWQIFLKMYFKGDREGILKQMLRLADGAPVQVRAEVEVNPVNMV